MPMSIMHANAGSCLELQAFQRLGASPAAQLLPVTCVPGYQVTVTTSMHGFAGSGLGEPAYLRLRAAPTTQLLIVTSVPETGCSLPHATKQMLAGILNKHNYARWHSYQFHCSVGNVDATIRPEGATDVRFCHSCHST